MKQRDLGLGAIEVKSVGVEMTAEAEGEFVARVAVFGNVDRFGDRLLPGAFAKSLAAWSARDAHIPVIYQHAWGEPPIGHVLEAAEDAAGLVTKATLYHEDDPLAAKVLRGLRKKSLSEFSFAYEVKSAALVFEGDEVVRELREVDLIECGPCLRGVNPETELLAVKSRIVGRKAGRTLSSKTLAKLRGIAQDLVAFCEEHDPPDTPKTELEPGADEKARAVQRDWLTRRRITLLAMST